MIVPIIAVAAVPQAAATATPAAATEALSHHGALWRLLAASGRPPPYHDAVEAAVLGRFLARPQWRRLLATSTPLAREAEGVGTTLWWNAAADAGLLIRWRRRGDGWRAVATRTYVGTGGADPATAARTARAALATTPRSGDEGVALTRGAEETVGLAATSAERLASGEGLLIRGALPVAGEGGDLGRWLATMPVAARRGLVPVARRAAADGEAIWWQSTAAPRALIVLRYPADRTVLMPSAIEVVDLEEGR